MYVYVCICMYMYMYAFVCICICMHVYVYVIIHLPITLHTRHTHTGPCDYVSVFSFNISCICCFVIDWGFFISLFFFCFCCCVFTYASRQKNCFVNREDFLQRKKPTWKFLPKFFFFLQPWQEQYCLPIYPNFQSNTSERSIVSVPYFVFLCLPSHCPSTNKHHYEQTPLHSTRNDHHYDPFAHLFFSLTRTHVRRLHVHCKPMSCACKTTVNLLTTITNSISPTLSHTHTRKHTHNTTLLENHGPNNS